MSEDAQRGWAGLGCIVAVICGGFAVDAGWETGGLMTIAMGLLILSAIVSASQARP